MKPKAHLYFVIWHSCIELYIISVVQDVLELVDLSYHFDKRKHSEVCYLLVFQANFFRRIVDEVQVIFEFPD